MNYKQKCSAAAANASVNQARPLSKPVRTPTAKAVWGIKEKKNGLVAVFLHPPTDPALSGRPVLAGEDP